MLAPGLPNCSGPCGTPCESSPAPDSGMKRLVDEVPPALPELFPVLPDPGRPVRPDPKTEETDPVLGSSSPWLDDPDLDEPPPELPRESGESSRYATLSSPLRPPSPGSGSRRGT